MKLTDQQLAAVENRGGSLLVSAAAGSGKTKVLVERLFRYITEEHCNVDDFLIITYTRAAASELRGKIAAELSRRTGEAPGDTHLRRQLLRVYQADIKTVDSFCTALLRENTHLLAQEGDQHALTPDFRVLDDDEALLLRRRVLDRVLETFYESFTPNQEQLADTLGAGRDDRALVELVLEFYEKLQSHASPDAWLNKSRETWANLDGGFDETIYAQELLRAVRRRAAHWAAQLRQGAERMAGDSNLEKSFGAKFCELAQRLQGLSLAGSWEAARQAANLVVFPRLVAPRGRKDEPAVVSLRQIWTGCQGDLKKMQSWLGVSGEDAMEDLRAVAPAMLALLDLTADFSAACRAEKLRMNAADFSDQEHNALRLLAGPDGTPTELGEQVAARYVEILVDEYQDTNEVQNAIFRAVSKNGKNLFTVGDVKQSIYRFRLADPTIFLDKYTRFQAAVDAADGEDRKISLSRNFRSRQEILDAANFVFANILSTEMGEMEYDADAALYFGADYYPARSDCETEFHLVAARMKSVNNPSPVKKLTAEARFAALRIRQLLDSEFPVTGSDGVLRPCKPEDIVILMRSPGSRTVAFAAALAERNIPCSFQEDSGFFDTMEVSTVVALLELIDNPRQDVPLISVLRSPVFGFTPDRLAELRSASPGGDFYDAVTAAGGADCMEFLEILDKLRQASQDMSVRRLVWHIYNALNLLGIFGAMDCGLERRENLIALARQAEKFESGGYRGLFAFVTQLRRLLEAGKAPEASGAAAVNGVRLMSIHKSKGLEFPIVFLADLEHAFSRQDFDTPVLVHPEMGLGPQRVDLQRKIRYPTLARLAVEEKIRRENLAEEQRILYVAMTRPKEKLILIHSLYSAEKRLQKLAAAAACPVPPESVAAGRSFGDWLLLPLLCRPEANILRNFAGAEMDALTVGGAPWTVFVHDSEEFRNPPGFVGAEETEVRPETPFEPELLSFAYPYRLETQLPAKLTATQLKGRLLDDEISENAAHTPYIRPLSQPKFRREHKGLTPAEKGTAMHLVLQYLNFHNPDAAAQVAALRERNLLTPEQAESVDVSVLEQLLASPLAEELRAGRNLLREYRFTLLVDARTYNENAAGGDTILLQGVVDCCFETDAGLTVIDFKTDHVWPADEIQARAEHYRPQIEAYSLALEQVLEKKVARRILYFLASGKVVEL
ncbi:MAG: helicase-exonuclease AddAB subunit AddA [Oscillibacter sp.]|jgi:ATP-dependent helicase/nuclease subunit A|nr:helicase-exonuclease AddAB subunit AddA [Oscillibacter sp.]